MTLATSELIERTRLKIQQTNERLDRSGKKIENSLLFLDNGKRLLVKANYILEKRCNATRNTATKKERQNQK